MLARSRSALAALFVGSASLTWALAACSDGAPVTDAGADAPADVVSPTQDASSSDAGDAASGDVPVEIRFAGRVGAQPFSCSKTFTVGTPATEVSPHDFRLYVHDVRLVRADQTSVPIALQQDGKWQYQNVALLDFEDKTGSCANGTPETNDRVRGTVPAGSYVGLAFQVGVPFALNHANAATAPSPLNLTAMFWNWAGGYKFLRVDVRATAPDGGVMDGGAPPVFNVHLGSTACQGNPAEGGVVTSCDRPNRPSISFPNFDPAKNLVVVDYAALVAQSNVAVNGGGMPGCMSEPSDPECVVLLPRLGLDVATGAPVAGQVLFKVE
jgi:uncharacterized repeat protein (TIGR04052 family)